MLNDFSRGFSYFLQGFRLVREPSLMRFVWIPLLCNILLFIIMLVFAGYGLSWFSHWVEQFLPSWLQWLHWVIWVLSFLFSGIILLFISTFIVNIIAGPFNSILAEKVLVHLQAADKIVQVSMMRALPSAFWRQMQFLGFYLPRALVYLLFFLIPIIQMVAAILWFMFNAWVFTMQYLDYPMDLHGVSIPQMKERMREKRGVCLGFGTGVVLFAMIPFLNFVVVPVAVVGATLLWVNEFRQ